MLYVSATLTISMQNQNYAMRVRFSEMICYTLRVAAFNVQYNEINPLTMLHIR